MQFTEWGSGNYLEFELQQEKWVKADFGVGSEKATFGRSHLG